MKRMTRKAICILLVGLLWLSAMSVGALAESVNALGDVDGDRLITSTDARLVLQYYAGKISRESLDAEAADVDGDRLITSTDARLVLQYYAGKIQKFPAQAGGEPTYVEFPTVPDFGAIYGVRADYRSFEDGCLFVEYSYEDIGRVDPDWDILVDYEELLQVEWGFLPDGTSENDEGGTNFWYENRDGSITLTLSFWDDAWTIAIFDNTYQSNKKPTYTGFPEVPDFGAIYGVREDNRIQDEDSIFLVYLYDDISRVDPEWDITVFYSDLLIEEYGFTADRTSEDSDGNTVFWYTNGDRSVSVALSFQDDYWNVFAIRNK